MGKFCTSVHPVPSNHRPCISSSFARLDSMLECGVLISCWKAFLLSRTRFDFLLEEKPIRPLDFLVAKPPHHPSLH